MIAARYGADAPDPGLPEPSTRWARAGVWWSTWLGMDAGLTLIIASAVAVIGGVWIALATW